MKNKEDIARKVKRMIEEDRQRELVKYKKEGSAAWITLNRPEKLNTWDFPGQGGVSGSILQRLG